MLIPKGRCAVVDFNGPDDLRLISTYGSVSIAHVSRREELKAPKDVPWVIAGRITFGWRFGWGSEEVELWCDNQRALELRIPVKNDLARWVEEKRRVTVYTAPQFSDVAQIVAQSLQRFGAKVKIVKRVNLPFESDAILIDDAARNPIIAKLVAENFGVHFVGHEGWSFWRRDTMRVWQPWAGLILSRQDAKGRWLVVITGHTEAAVRVAAIKFCTLRMLGSYCAAPFVGVK